MFGVPLATMAWIIPLVLISLWLLHILTRRFLYSKTITWIHILITEIATILILIVLYIGIHPTEFTNDRHELIGLEMQILSILFVLGKIAFFVNALLGFFTIQKAQGLKS